MTQLIAVLCLLSLCAPAWAGGGTAVGGSGDEAAQAFLKKAIEVEDRLVFLAYQGDYTYATPDEVRRIQALHPDVLSEERLFLRMLEPTTPFKGVKITAEEFEAASHSPDEAVRKSVREVSAINYPLDSMIYVSRTRWDSSLDAERFSLVLHELLGLIGKEDPGYAISGSYGQFVQSGALFPPSVPPYGYRFAIQELAMEGYLSHVSSAVVYLQKPVELRLLQNYGLLNPFPRKRQCYSMDAQPLPLPYRFYCFESLYDLAVLGRTRVRFANEAPWNPETLENTYRFLAEFDAVRTGRFVE